MLYFALTKARAWGGFTVHLLGESGFFFFFPVLSPFPQKEENNYREEELF